MNHEQKNINHMLLAGPVEIRAKAPDKWWTGVFDDYRLLNHCGLWANRKGFEVYTSLNPNNVPVTNRLRHHRAAVKDENILRIVRLPFDFDPERETGTAATEEQLASAGELANDMIDFFTACGWPVPLVAISGNGYHVQYSVNLLRDAITKDLLRRLYRGLDACLSTTAVRFDPTVRNPSRIFRMYSTINHKSGRRSKIVSCGDFEPVSFELIENMSALLTPVVPVVEPCAIGVPISGRSKNFDVVNAFRSNGLYKRSLGDGKHAVTCIHVDRHTDGPGSSGTDTVIWEQEYPQFHCSHAHCDGLTIHDVIKQFS